MLQFHVILQARPHQATDGGQITLAGRDYAVLNVPGNSLAEPFDVASDDALAALADLPRMFVEPDGAFVWASPDEDLKWQVEGTIYDRGDRVAYVEMKGCCSVAAFDRLLAAFGWPDKRIVFQLMREAVWLDEVEFRRFASA